MHRVKVFDVSVASRTAETKARLRANFSVKFEEGDHKPACLHPQPGCEVHCTHSRSFGYLGFVGRFASFCCPKNWSAEAEGTVEKIRATHELPIPPSGLTLRAALQASKYRLFCVIFLPSRGSSRVCGSHRDNSWARQRAERVQFLMCANSCPISHPSQCGAEHTETRSSQMSKPLRLCHTASLRCLPRSSPFRGRASAPRNLHLLAASLVPLIIRHRLGRPPSGAGRRAHQPREPIASPPALRSTRGPNADTVRTGSVENRPLLSCGTPQLQLAQPAWSASGSMTRPVPGSPPPIALLSVERDRHLRLEHLERHPYSIPRNATTALMSTRFACLLVMAPILAKGIGDCHITRIPWPFAPRGYCRTSRHYARAGTSMGVHPRGGAAGGQPPSILWFPDDGSQGLE